MANRITIFLKGEKPDSFDLDEKKHRDEGRGRAAPGQRQPEEYIVRFGRGSIHGRDKNVDPPNDISVGTDDPRDDRYRYVSRAQCTFHSYGGKWYVVDDQSTNGMVYGGQKVASMELHDGDKIYIGNEGHNDQRMIILFSTGRFQRQEDANGYSLGSGTFVIGRDPGCNLVIPHPMASRRHCIITREGDGYYIEDNNSTNGVVVNGSLLDKKKKLNPMDQIMIADTSLFFNDGVIYFSKPTGGISLAAEHLVKKVKKSRSEMKKEKPGSPESGEPLKTIMRDVSVSIAPNEFVAIIGGSGAGKTTLMDCLSGMTDFTSGDVLINGESIRTAGKSLRGLIGYVPQQDIVYDMLTLERMLFHSAKLRMPKDTSVQEIWAKIDETLKTVELEKHRSTLIKKLSGGQRKRASIAVELLASPKLFFLDEPSSGLDPGTEKHLMQMLKRLSDSGKTVVMVTHTVQNLDLCDRVICMGNGGRLCFSGPPSQAASFFGKPQMTDIYDDLDERSEQFSQRFRQYADFTGAARQGQQSPASAPKHSRGPGALLRQLRVLTLRYGEIMKNDWGRMLTLILMPPGLALLVCLAYQADGGLLSLMHISVERVTFPFLVASDTMSMVSAFSAAAFWVGIFNSIQEISKERPIFRRERFTGVGVSPYLLSKFLVLTLLCLIQSAIMTEVLWLMSSNTAIASSVGASASDMAFSMSKDGVVFSGSAFWLELYLTGFLCVLSAMCLGLLISSAFSNDMAMVLCPICLLPQILFSGVATELVGLTVTVSKIISCRWSCVAFLTSVNVNEMYTGCSYDDGGDGWVFSDDGSKYTNMAYTVDRAYVAGLDPVRSAWLALGILSIVCLVAAGAALYLRREKNR